jgi:putative aminopeptidase FrvX
MVIANERELSVIKALAEAKGPSGFEDETVAAVRQILGDICDFEEDSLRNLYIYRRKNSGNKPTLMLDAHSDEVGFIIHSIKPNGTLRFLELGGWSKNTLPGTRVLVRNHFGEWIRGMIAAKPPHFLSDEERAQNKVQSVSSLVIDIGARSADEAKDEFGIRIGEPAVPATPFEYDEKRDIMFGKGFDCRIGCAALVETMRVLSSVELDVDIVGVLSSQEEVGERGCKVAVNRVKPDAALVFEGCPADDTFGEAYAMQALLKKGPMLRFMDKSVICNPRFQRFALDTAEKNSLAVQASVREGGGNNAAVIQAQLIGAPSIVMGVPVRYIHGPNCITTFADYSATVKLACAIATGLNADIIKSF